MRYHSRVSTSLTIADVERVAALAQLELTAEEKALFTRQLADILRYAEQIQALDTRDVPATAHVRPASEAERDDEPRPCLQTADAWPMPLTAPPTPDSSAFHASSAADVTS